MTSASAAPHPAVRGELVQAVPTDDLWKPVTAVDGRTSQPPVKPAERHRKGKGRQVNAQAGREQRLRRYWNSHAGSYDRQMGFFDRHLFADSREWICSKATGSVLEVAIGTGLNLPHYPAGVQLTGVDYSPAMLQIAHQRAGQLGREVDLREGDAQALEFPGAMFDTVVCTFSLCAIPDDRAAVAEMVRVLRPGGLLLLADHVTASPWPARAAQALIELASVPVGGEYLRRRPIRHVRALALTVEDHDRFKLGIVERLAARKP
jgi:ubiquinone/menaquinone biosynthesis C-methylase UbiE